MAFTRTFDGEDPIRLNKWMGQTGVCSRREADALIAAQMPAERKRARADVVIDNAGSRAELEAAIAMLITRLRATAAR